MLSTTKPLLSDCDRSSCQASHNAENCFAAPDCSSSIMTVFRWRRLLPVAIVFGVLSILGVIFLSLSTREELYVCGYTMFEITAPKFRDRGYVRCEGPKSERFSCYAEPRDPRCAERGGCTMCSCPLMPTVYNSSFQTPNYSCYEGLPPDWTYFTGIVSFIVAAVLLCVLLGLLACDLRRRPKDESVALHE
eukprot:TRINITY_DN23506_c0_g1_i1.p1 TRINITY_DN23506_c0_g1~~TRINITY_DN23506_c0_g1_i1.p1  ORF type:complete len:191 (+),score=37.40 TRINITY_DN23506_c0_g1_i1:380-952(+)